MNPILSTSNMCLLSFRFEPQESIIQLVQRLNAILPNHELAYRNIADAEKNPDGSAFFISLCDRHKPDASLDPAFEPGGNTAFFTIKEDPNAIKVNPWDLAKPITDAVVTFDPPKTGP